MDKTEIVRQHLGFKNDCTPAQQRLVDQVADLFDRDLASPEAIRFVCDLVTVCFMHGLMLSVRGYDGLQVWKLEDSDCPIHAPWIEDCTRRGD